MNRKVFNRKHINALVNAYNNQSSDALYWSIVKEAELDTIIEDLSYKQSKDWALRQDRKQDAYAQLPKIFKEFDPERSGSFRAFAYFRLKWLLVHNDRRDRVIPIADRGHTRSSVALMYSPTPESHSEVKKLAKEKNLPYEEVLRYAYAHNSVEFQESCMGETEDEYINSVLVDRVLSILEQKGDREEVEYLLQRSVMGEDASVILKDYKYSQQNMHEKIRHLKAQLKGLLL